MTKSQFSTQFRIWGISGSLSAALLWTSPECLAGGRSVVYALQTDGVESTNTIKLEEAIASANDEELSHLEIKVARLLQESPSNLQANYLMSTLLLRMFTLDPGSYSLIKQSTELAAQTYDLDRKSDLGIAALANILETSGEFERGIAMLNDVTKRGFPLGWRSQLAKAKLLANGHNPDAVLKLLDDALSSSEASHVLIAPTLIAVILEKYD